MQHNKELIQHLRLRLAGWLNKRRVTAMTRHVAQRAQPDPDQKPVIFFNASTRLMGLSLNAAFQLIASWGLRLAGIPVIQFTCQAGMNPCVLGLDRQDFHNPPPCQPCIAQTQHLYDGASLHPFRFQPDEDLAAALEGLSVAELCEFEYPFGKKSKIPLGQMVVSSVRWTLRMHHLADDEPMRYLLRQYIQSAYNVACQFDALIRQSNPSAAVIFNGMLFPEAAARWVARKRHLRAITHEVGFQRFSAFFTEGEATAYPIHIPDSFELTPEQNARLDRYLEKRFQGQFTMAGIRFWPEMRGLDPAFLEKAARFRQVVPVFTNVVFDTSQVHANTTFPHMFAWLELVADVIRAHPETLFVIRAHPDEKRPNSAKQSRESVSDWLHRHAIDVLPNVVFIDSQEYISSYELIQRAKFVLVYNSSIGLEATLMGTPVLCGGKARYTQYPIVFFPDSPKALHTQMEDFLKAELIQVPEEFQRNARRFLYYQLYRASLPFDAYIQAGPRQGFVQLRPFSWRQLLPERSPTMQILVDGILGREKSKKERFLLRDIS
ncbi:MAG: hypothetical protein P8Z00_00875 [Anaerolineales bacterium]|jgi:hypothetical protein